MFVANRWRRKSLILCLRLPAMTSSLLRGFECPGLQGHQGEIRYLLLLCVLSEKAQKGWSPGGRRPVKKVKSLNYKLATSVQRIVPPSLPPSTSRSVPAPISEAPASSHLPVSSQANNRSQERKFNVVLFGADESHGVSKLARL